MAGAANITKQLKRGLRRPAQMLSRLNKGLWRPVFRLLIGSLIGLMLFGCVNRAQSVRLIELPNVPSNDEVRRLNGNMSEVAPPAIFSDLNDLLEDVQPQVAIASPKPNQVIDTTTLTAKITLRGLSIYKDEKLELGPHLQVSLDNQPSRSIYSLDEAIEFLDLTPGSHTLRVFAVKPWGESFKNEAAYAQTTFHIFAKTYENAPDPNKPQLIYSEPQGTYGAQPILLDFYLNNAPLHLIAKEDPDIADWKIRCDVNGQSFVFDQWQPIYLKGFEPGQNWVHITLIDEQGNPIDNAFNSTVRLINYDPEQRDTLARLVRGELPLEEAGKVVDPTYEPPIDPVVGEKESIYNDERLDNHPPENNDIFDRSEKEQDDLGKLPEVTDPSKALGLEASPMEKPEMEDDSSSIEDDDLPEALSAPNEATAPSSSDELDSFDEFAAEKLKAEELETERLEAERLELERLEAEELTIKKLDAEASAVEALEEKAGSLDEQSEKTQSIKSVEQSIEDVLEETTEDLEDIKESTEDRLEETVGDLEESAGDLLEDKTTDFKESVDDLKAAIEQRSSFGGDVSKEEATPTPLPTNPVRPEKSVPTEPRPKLFDRLKTAFQQFRSSPPVEPEPILPTKTDPLEKLTIPELSDKIQPELDEFDPA